ncbi:MAG: hypothetical protein H6817_04795 [Phycisphaerales bacterium]|nr:hypothetical protein [Phycisphaerales bacterium]
MFDSIRLASFRSPHLAVLVFGAFLLVSTYRIEAGVLPGDSDSTFGSNGVVIAEFGGTYDEFAGLAIGSGKFAAAGMGGPSNRFAVAVYDMNGTPDMGFGNGGSLIIDQTAGSAAVEWLPDGKLLIGPAWLGGSFGFMIARLMPDGSYDPTFGSGGKTTRPVGSQPYVEAIGVQTDGKIVLGGYSYFTDDWKWAFVRFNANGTLDTSFGGGTVITDFGADKDDMCYDFVLQPDNKIVAGGSAGETSIRDLFALARYNTDGTLDGTFGVGGKVVIPTEQIANSGRFEGVALQSDGAIVACGSADGNSVLMRFDTTGALDSTFADGGVLIFPVASSSDYLDDLAIDSAGRIIAAGNAYISGHWRQFVTRILPDGTIDGSFGIGGVVLSDHGTSWEFANAVDLATPDRILVGGSVGDANVNYNGSVTRFINNTGLSGETVSAHPTADGQATSPNGFAFSILVTGDLILVERKTSPASDSRGLLEFDLSGIPDEAAVLSADLTIDIAGLSYFAGESYPYIIAYGYDGNGTLDPPDPRKTDTEIGVSIPIMTQDPLTISFHNLDYIESLIQGGASHIGIILYAGRTNHYSGFVANEGAALYNLPAPTLSIEYAVSVPGDLDGDGDLDSADLAVLVNCMTGPTPIQIAGDFDNDGDVDGHDFAMWEECLAGPEVIVDSACDRMDFDADADVDLADFAAIAEVSPAPAHAPAPGCEVADFDVDADVDLYDAATFYGLITH